MKISKILKNNTVWVSSDHHFGHANILTFKTSSGEPLRPWTDLNEMEEELIARWNSVVKPHDYIIHCGDFSMNRDGYVRTIGRLNGRKILIMGNHDTLSIDTYLKHFEYVTSMIVLHHRAILTHIPIHPASIGSGMVNIHGHLHDFDVLLDNQPDLRYISACVEKHNFYPVNVNDLIQNAKVVLNQNIS